MDNNNNNSPPHNHDEEDDDTLDIPATCYQPPITFLCATDIPANSPPPRSFLVALNMPRVPFIVNMRPIPNIPSMAVTCGVVPLSVCGNYVEFVALLCVTFRITVEPVENPSLQDPIPGYEISYELMGPDRRRFRFLTHPWSVFKALVRIIVIEKL